MPFLVPVVVALAVAGVVAIVVAASKPTRFEVKRPGDLVDLVGTIKGIKVAPRLEGVGASQEEPGDVYVGPPTELSVSAGWTPVYITNAQNRLLEWGACYYQWQSDLGGEYAEDSAFASWVVEKMGVVMNYVIDLAPVIGWLVRRICFRVEIPCTVLTIDGKHFFTVQSPRDEALPVMSRQSSTAWALPGFNPDSTRNGFAVEYGAWPLEWPPPAGVVATGWLRNLGDITGTGYDTWQLVSVQNGSDRSFPLMEENGWRAVFGFSERNWPGHSNGDALSMFNAWRGDDATAVSKHAATKTKADNRYAKPR